MTKVAPSLLSADFAKLGEESARFAQMGADYVHFDVMDGSYVPAITFGAGMLQAIRPHTELPLDVHLMVMEPERHVEAFVKAGADLITFHPETCKHPHNLLQVLHKLGVKAGVVLDPSVPVCQVEYLLDLCDIVLVMSVNPGAGGQKFIPSALDKVRKLAGLREQRGYSYEIEIDGGINGSTCRLAVEAGVDVLVAGSAVFGASDPAHMVSVLKGEAQ